MHALLRHAVSSLLIVAATQASAAVITQDGVVFMSTFTGNVLRLEIDAAKRSGGWAGASAIDALAIKTVGSFSGVGMSSSTGADWTLSSAELNASDCAGKGKAKADNARLCFSGGAVDLADNMVFTFTFEGSPSLAAPHLKVHFVNAGGAKTGSLLSMDFPWQAESIPALTGGMQQGGGDAQSGAVPEPQSLAIVGAGLAVMGLARRRRRTA